MPKTIKCPTCGKRMSRDTRPDTITYKGQSVALEQPGWYCCGCDDVVFEATDSDIHMTAFLRLKTSVDNSPA